ncbi:MAG: OOP family OmpA-OmpF porin [Porticoccaceae bacterium]|jgi:OOP family OmpA-OmpF porin
MKHLRTAFLALLLVAGFSNVNAQDEDNPWAISVGVNAVDFHPTNHPGEINNGGDSSQWFNEFFNAGDHYNMIPSVSRIAVGKYLADGFSLEMAGTINRISKIGNKTNEQNPGDLNYIGADLGIKYDLNNIIGDTKWFDPYAQVGGGYTWLDSEGTGTLNGGLGMNFWLGETIGLNIQSTYKHAFDDVNVSPHFQHSAGVIFKFGGTDTDGDGIYDKKDACPEVFGLEAFNGCPDTDGDGIIDGDDACPDVAGLAALNGCPDADGDGIADAKDACPNVKGTAANNGCPDTDGDGIIDGEDKCPKIAGPAANNGCPWPDTDGDSILDKDDKCPDVAGVAEHNGCPPPAKMSEANVAELENLSKTVYFNSSKDSFTNDTDSTLDKIVNLIKDFPSESFNIAGHTDSTGSSASNQVLSEQRASAVKTYLSSKVGNSFTVVGHGESSPTSSNNTRAGRAENRRVEIKLVK